MTLGRVSLQRIYRSLDMVVKGLLVGILCFSAQVMAKGKLPFTTVARGVSHPGLYTTTFGIENPAGLARLEGFSITTNGQADDDFRDPAYSVLIAHGDKDFAGTIGATSTEDGDSDSIGVRWGVAAYAVKGLSVGIVGSSIGSIQEIDLGVLFEIFDGVTIGAMGFDVKEDPEKFAAGLSIRLSDQWMIAVDSFFPKSGSSTIWGALSYAKSDFNVSGGVRVRDDNYDYLGSLGYRLTKSIILQYFYDVHDTHSLSLSAEVF